MNKKICSILLAGAIVITPANVCLKNANALVIDDKSNLSYSDFCYLAYNISVYLKEYGLDIDINQIFNCLYIQNIEYIDNITRDELISNNIISSDRKVLLDDCVSLLSSISNYNDSLFIKSLNKGKNVKNIDYIYISKMFVNNRDKGIADIFDTMLIKYINSGKKDSLLFNDLYNGYTFKQTETNYDLEEASMGARMSINLTSGTLFYNHVGPMYMGDNTNYDMLSNLVNCIYDVSDIYKILNNKTLKK